MTWGQVNIALARTTDPVLEQARRVFDEVVPALDAFRLDGRLRRFHFMRKPPDIRLRLEGPDAWGDLLPPVARILDRLQEAGAVVTHSPGIYEPETRLFGGERAMSLVHDYFDVDSRGWVDHDRLVREGSAVLTAEELTGRVANDLFARTLGDQAEVWDAWCNVHQVVAGAQPADGEGTDDTATRGPAPAEEMAGARSTGESAILERYRAADTELATGLRALAQRGELECGLRALLPFVAVFHFHRYGLDQRRQRALALTMVEAWDPRRGMRGAE